MCPIFCIRYPIICDCCPLLRGIKIKDTDTEIRATATLCPKYLSNVAHFWGVAHILGYNDSFLTKWPDMSKVCLHLKSDLFGQS